MKTIEELRLDSNHVLNEQDLEQLRGGTCMCYTNDPIPSPMGYMAATNQAECYYNCGAMGWTGTFYTI
jgi:hypothetical protein